MTPIIRMPSTSGESAADIFVKAPKGWPLSDAITRAEAAIKRANEEDAASDDGCCADGRSVEESIRKELERQGFRYLDIPTTSPWDADASQAAGAH